MAPVHELNVLKKLEPSKRHDEDSWPEFLLRDVVVRNKSSQEPFSLLSAYIGDLAQVEGVLHEAESAHPERHLKKGFKKVHIFLDDVRMYSYGLDEENPTCSFWAAGDSGWFKLQSVSRAYKHIYQQMQEAALLLYHLSDKVKRQRRTFAGAPWKEIEEHVKLVFRDFKKSEYNRLNRIKPEDCYQAFEQHRFFLIKCMLEKAEGYDWQHSPFFTWHLKMYPDDVKFMRRVVEQKASGPIGGSKQPKKEEDEEGQEEEEGMEDESMEEGHTSGAQTRKKKGKKSRTRSAASKSTPPPPSPPPQQEITRAVRATRRTRSQAVGAAREGGSIPGDVDRRKAQGRSIVKRKRKSMLRPYGALGSKTPTKSNLRRDGLQAYSSPTMREVRTDTMELDDKDVSDEEDEKVVRAAYRREIRTRSSAGRAGASEGSEDEDSSDDEDEDNASEEDEEDDEEEEEEDEDMKEEEDDDDDENDDDDDTGNEEGSRKKNSSLQPNREYYEPKGPDNTWTCPLDGCSHTVWDARSPVGVSLIQQHYATSHGDSIEELIMSEERPWAKVSNLLAKVRAFKEGGGAGERNGFPKPIERKY